jgi:hypothetical protein
MRLVLCSATVLLSLAAATFAQTPTQQLPLQTTSGTGFSSAPYSGRETTVKTQTLTDGTITTETHVELICRDAQGRTRREMIQQSESGDEYRSIVITDPVGGMYLKWEVGNPLVAPQVSIWPLARAQTVIAAPPAGNALSPNQGSTRSIPGVQRDRLPAQEINGVYAEGSRTVRTTHLEGEINNRVIEVTNELWVSPDLRIIVRHVLDDPRTGRTVTDVTDVVRGDPDPGLFRAPEGYPVADHRERPIQDIQDQ